MVKSIEIVPALSYYNTIAEHYNAFMAGDSDTNVRKIVSEEFKKNIKEGNILDFGGGTGMDLPWLLENKRYKLFFFEPSLKMRSIAQKILSSIENTNIPVFIEQDVDFSDWSYERLPFQEKADGVLANFAVLNCIKNISEFFEKISLVCNKNCQIIATVLDTRQEAIRKNYSLKIRIRTIFTSKIVIYNNYNGIGHATYLHTLKQFRDAADKYFNFVSYKPVGSSDFALLKLTKK
jgi:ubiquinone/menaquinone biosynthesis C-methylase UbiE